VRARSNEERLARLLEEERHVSYQDGQVAAQKARKTEEAITYSNGVETDGAVLGI
jgi:hypothetical protein